MGLDTNKLTTMSKNAPDLSANVGQSISSIDDALTELNSQKDAVQDGVCGNAETLAVAFITNIIFPLYPLAEEIGYGPGFGTIAWFDPGPVGNIAAWYLYRDILGVPTPVYIYTPGAFPVLDVLVADYAFGNDQLTRPLTDGATYGITPNISVLGTGRDILQENQDKLDAATAVYDRYST